MSITALLVAHPDVVIIDVEAAPSGVTPTGKTKIEYSKEADYVIWHRWKGDWMKKGLVVTGDSDPAHTSGKFDSPDLEAGDVYEVSLWDKGIDANQPPIKNDKVVTPHAAISVYALRKRPREVDFLQDQNSRTGGTYRERDIFTTKPVRVWMAVSTDPGSQDADGIWSFPRIDGSTFEDRKQQFNLQIFDLLPGTHYNEILRLTDESGNWRYIPGEFTTKKRRIRVLPIEIFVHDDSDPRSTGEGVFKCILQTGQSGSPSSWIDRGETSVANGDFDDNAALLAVPAEIVFGPVAVTRTETHARVHASGVEDDSSYFDIGAFEAASGAKELDIPVNTVDEKVDARRDEIHADLGDSLVFTLKYDYWIEYF